MMYLRHIGRLHSLVADCPAMAEASMLLKVWLRQRTSTKGKSFAVRRVLRVVSLEMMSRM
jgi:hypothetical protein